ALAFAAVLALMPVAAEATISRAMEFDQKVEKAAAIVVGKVVSQESRWDAGQKRILTYSTFQVEKTLKGAQAAQTTIVTPGGVVGDVAQEFVGVPRFRVGDEHVVFVRNTSVGPTVLYFDQGAYRVSDEGGQRMVHPLVSTTVLVDTQRGMAVAPEDARPMREFETRVRGAQERRQRYQMEMVRKRQQEASFLNQIQSNKTLVALALLGIALASWQFYKRS
ncbi:MAG: hypothetical protein QOJ98_1837, partial [Acidobacteriota bacterium]|nr:hypothetical protein [Acidobacteriota bacterium]